MEALTVSEDQSGQCANPLCKAELPESTRKGKRYCNERCRMDGWVLKRAVSLLTPMGRVKGLIVLRDIADGCF